MYLLSTRVYYFMLSLVTSLAVASMDAKLELEENEYVHSGCLPNVNILTLFTIIET